MYSDYFPTGTLKVSAIQQEYYTKRKEIKMNTIEFLAGLCGQQKMDIRTMSASDYFEGPGLKLIDFIAGKLEVEGLTFKITSCAIREIESHPFYVGRNFIHDMEEIGFVYMIIAYASENGSPILTFQFSIKD